MSKEEAKQNDNFHIDKGSVSCNLCRCGRKAFHKETKTTTDKEGNTVVNQIEERSSWRLGTGRGTTPDLSSLAPVAPPHVQRSVANATRRRAP